tara:strand:+ start:3028 stop:3408 length:381 start_codon:yes stop_codon:yes gene_type:complete
VTALTNGNYVVRSPFWDYRAVAGAGAVTFGNGTTGDDAFSLLVGVNLPIYKEKLDAGVREAQFRALALRINTRPYGMRCGQKYKHNTRSSSKTIRFSRFSIGTFYPRLNRHWISRLSLSRRSDHFQ